VNEVRRLVLYSRPGIIICVKNSPVYVIGTGLSHDSSVCLLADGKVVLGIEKERLTRRKHDRGNDRVAMQYVLDRAGITLGDVALVVQNENFGMFRSGNSEYGREPRLLTDDTQVVTISHHLAHAYSAFGPSGFDQASVLVIDGCGNAYEDCTDLLPGTLLEKVASGYEHIYFEKDSYYTSQGNTLHVVAKDFSIWGAREWLVNPPTTLHSIGGVYQAFSQYVFGGDFDDSGKLMGLAPYGKPGRFGLSLFDLRDGQVFVRRDSLLEFTSPAGSLSALKADFEYYADVAHWVQMEIERALLYVVEDRFERCPSRNLAYAGGVALNAVANSRILRETGFENLYIQPAAGDNGLAIGCAYYGWLEVLGREHVHSSGSTYLGAPYPADRVRSAVAAAGDQVVAEEDADPVARVAQLLAEGKVVAWYRGGAEFGPRALGHRSILAHPGIPGLRDHINTDIKFREDFRPFAPSVLAHEAQRFFDCEGYDSPYMILVFDVRPEWRERLVNVVHEDGSSRLHTVTEESEPVYCRLLEEFQRLTGLPVLLNTSLNKRGMPIVETPEEALAFFLDCALDVLVLEDLVITKPEVKPEGPARVRGRIDHLSEHDIPLIGMRIASVDVSYPVNHAAPGEWQPADDVVLTFNDTPETITLSWPAGDCVWLCDGVRTYGSIAAQLELDINLVVRAAGSLARRGILDHVDRDAEPVVTD
jgi:carbamoyltransferase